MRPSRLAAALAVCALSVGMLAQAPALAMTDGAEVDPGGLYPGVVALVFVRADGMVSPYCSGMLINANVVLTASHCNEGTVDYAAYKTFRLGVTNDPAFIDPDGDGWAAASYRIVDPTTGVVSNPAYKGGYRDDVSIQIFTGDPFSDVETSDLGVLPEAGTLDRMKADGMLRGLPLRVLGYGTEAKTTPANVGPAYPDSNQRRYADLPTIALDKQWIHQDQNVGKNPDQEGACYGDSGGPSLLNHDGKTYVVGVTSTGDGPCFATNVASRVDTASVLAFLAPYRPQRG